MRHTVMDNLQIATDFSIEPFEKAFEQDKKALEEAIAQLNSKTVTVRHLAFPTADGNADGYFFLSTPVSMWGTKKERFVKSAYELPTAKGEWNYESYERIYYGQLLLTAYLENIRSYLENSKSTENSKVKMDITVLYAFRMLDNTDNIAKTDKSPEEQARDLEIVKGYREIFLKEYAKECEEFRSFTADGGSALEFYNGGIVLPDEQAV